MSSRPLTAFSCISRSIAGCAISFGAVCLALASCNSGGGGGGSHGGAPGGSTSNGPFGLTARVQVAGLNLPTGLPTPTPLEADAAFPNLPLFDEPVHLASPADGTNRLFVVEKPGRIRVFANDPTVADTELFLDITEKVDFDFNEEGFLGLAFDPDYAQSGQFYVFYTANAPNRSILSRYEVSADPDVADAGSEEIILELPRDFSHHNGGMLAFGPDGYLYISLGENGVPSRAQDLTDLFGKILRIDVSTTPYTIPPDNPLASQGGGVRGEIFAWGLRNPWRMSFDRQSGELWVGDVGQGNREELNRVSAGDNLGWDYFEGTVSYNNPQDLPAADFAEPIFDYSHAEGVAVIGGYVYRGSDLAGMQGVYIYGDYLGPVWGLVYDATGAISNTLLIDNVNSLCAFGEDAQGELYAFSLWGGMWRLQASEPPPPEQQIPLLLSETGAFADLTALVPAPGVIGYTLNAPQWADGARIRRWIALPGTSQVTFAASGPWTFPVGTAIFLYLEIDLADGSARRLETRVLVHQASGWVGFSYKWNEAGTDAALIADPSEEILSVADPLALGGVREQVWVFPDPADCARCHLVPSGFTIGLTTRQLNRDFDYGDVVDNQLRSWNNIGLFDVDTGDATSYGALAALDDAAQPIAERARSYLAVNCAHCHQPESPVPVDADMRYETPLAAANLVGVAPTHGDLGLAGALRIAAGDKEASVLWERLRALDENRMPPAGSHVVDEAAVDLIGAWIDEGPD